MGCVNIGGCRSETLWNKTFGPTAANSISSTASHLATRLLPGVIFRRSMHCECLRRVCIPLSEKPFRQSAVVRALSALRLYLRSHGNVFARSNDTRRAAIEACRYSAGNNTEIINISCLRRLPGEANGLDHRVMLLLLHGDAPSALTASWNRHSLRRLLDSFRFSFTLLITRP